MIRVIKSFFRCRHKNYETHWLPGDYGERNFCFECKDCGYFIHIERDEYHRAWENGVTEGVQNVIDYCRRKFK